MSLRVDVVARSVAKLSELGNTPRNDIVLLGVAKSVSGSSETRYTPRNDINAIE